MNSLMGCFVSDVLWFEKFFFIQNVDGLIIEKLFIVEWFGFFFFVYTSRTGQLFFLGFYLNGFSCSSVILYCMDHINKCLELSVLNIISASGNFIKKSVLNERKLFIKGFHELYNVQYSLPCEYFIDPFVIYKLEFLKKEI